VFALVISCTFAAFPSKKVDVAEQQFAAWMVKHNIEYATPEEHAMRFENFKASLLRVQLKNQRGTNATFAINKFSDLSPAEFKAKYLMAEPVRNPKANRDVLKPTVSTLPSTFDWRDKKVVSPVKDQGQCGSCWAFSAVENVESVWMMAHNLTADQMPALAPQQLVDCDDFSLGCSGGNPPFAYEYLEGSGLEKESDYPYHATGGSCAFQKNEVYATIQTWKWATSFEDETTLQQNLVSVAPLSICLDAENWQDYSSGVMGEWECCDLCIMDHCVQLVGYNAQAGTPYWIVRNSWGSDWGVNGYIWIQMGHNTCGLTQEATTVVV